MSDNKKPGKAARATPTDRQTVSELARQSGAGLTSPASTSGVMCQQAQDWSRGSDCYPQTFVRLIGYRDPDGRPASSIRLRKSIRMKKVSLSDTPIG